MGLKPEGVETLKQMLGHVLLQLEVLVEGLGPPELHFGRLLLQKNGNGNSIAIVAIKTKLCVWGSPTNLCLVFICF